jgi:hypothetical protein
MIPTALTPQSIPPSGCSQTKSVLSAIARLIVDIAKRILAALQAILSYFTQRGSAQTFSATHVVIEEVPTSATAENCDIGFQDATKEHSPEQHTPEDIVAMALPAEELQGELESADVMASAEEAPSAHPEEQSAGAAISRDMAASALSDENLGADFNTLANSPELMPVAFHQSIISVKPPKSSPERLSLNALDIATINRQARAYQIQRHRLQENKGTATHPSAPSESAAVPDPAAPCSPVEAPREKSSHELMISLLSRSLDLNDPLTRQRNEAQKLLERATRPHSPDRIRLQSAEQVEKILEYCAHVIAKKLNPSDDELRQVKAFFFEVADFTNKKLYMDGSLRGKSELQSLLLRFLHEYVPEVDAAIPLSKNPATLTDDERLQLQIAKARLALRIGYPPVPTGEGANGAQFIIDPFEKGQQYIGVFKAPPSYGWSATDLANWFSKKVVKPYFGQARLLHHEPFDAAGRMNAEQFAEVAAYELGKRCGLKIAPPAAWVQLKHKNSDGSIKEAEGSFILFLRGFTPLSKIASILEERASPGSKNPLQQEEVDQIAMMCAGQFALGNLDPTFNDIFVRMDGEQRIQEMVAIDFGNAFKIRNGSTNNEGKYGLMPSADTPFSARVKDEIQQKFTDEVIDQWIGDLENKNCREFLTAEKEAQLRLRFQYVREGVAHQLEQFKSPAAMAHIKSDNDYSQIAATLTALRVS